MRTSLLLAAVVGGTALLAASPAMPDKAKIGQTPEYKFEAPVDNGLGVIDLTSFRGTPTLFEFWGTY